MSLATILAALAAMAVNFGWQKADDGYEYLVQLEPETVQLLSEGVDVPIDSHVPASIQPIRKVRIVVGRAELPREDVDDSNEPRTDERVERTTFFRPGETAPAADGRYGQPPASGTPSTLDTIVKPIRDVDDFVERGFEAGVDGLEKTGNAIRGTVDSAANTVQDQFRRTKETLVGASPESTYRGVGPAGATPMGGTAAPTGVGAPPSVASTQGWPNPTGGAGATTGDTGTIPNLPPPPALSGSETPAATTTAPNFGPSGWDNRETAPTTSSDNGGRMVPIEGAGTTSSAPEVQAWQPNAWPPVQANPASNPNWITNSPPANPTTPATTPEQPVGTSPISPPAPETKVVVEKPANENASESNEGKSIGSWTIAVAMIIGSMGGNIFQFFSYLDIRNKYRAALRRTSRSFSRPATSA